MPSGLHTTDTNGSTESLPGDASKKSTIIPLDNPLMILEQEGGQQDGSYEYDSITARNREVALLSKGIQDCFERHQKMPKTRIELYKVGRILGRGAFGKVHLGLHRLTRKLVAIKSTDRDVIKEESTKRKMQ